MDDRESRPPGVDPRDGNPSRPPSSTSEPSGVVLARVRELDHSAAVVDLEGDEEALLPWKNVWPDFKIHDEYDCFRVVEEQTDGKTIVQPVRGGGGGSDAQGRAIAVGDRLRVVPCVDRDFGKGKRKIVSHILVNGDPWNAVATWQSGDVKAFAIECVTDSWAWGRIPPGVRARASLCGLVGTLQDERWPGHQVPVPGDQIAGWYLPEMVDHEKRVIALDYIGYVRSQVSLKENFGVSASHPVTNQDAFDGSPNLLADLVVRAKISTLLVVDDDEALCSSLSQYLHEQCGVETLSCVDEQCALRAIEERGADIGLAIIDVNLYPNSREGKDHSGIRIARQIEKSVPDCPVVLMTGEELNPGKQAVSDASDLLLNDIVDKPLGRDGLFQALSAPGKTKRPLSDFLRRPAGENAAFAPRSGSEIEVALRDLRDSLGAEAAVLFAIDPISDEVAIEAIAGSSSKYNTEDKLKLGWSPIRDAAVRGEEVFASNALKSDFSPDPKHLYLQKAYHYRSCVGVPVKIGQASHSAYAVFAFHPDAKGLVKETALPLALRVAREVGQAIRIRQLEESIREMRPFAMMGQSYGSMAHDLARDMSSSFLLEAAIRQISSGAGGDAGETLQKVLSRLSRAQRIVRGFRSMAQGQREDVKVFRARKEIERIASRLATEVKEYKATLTLSTDRLAAERCLEMRRSHLDQLLTNLALNAAQQCERLSDENGFSRTGEIQIEAFEERCGKGYPWVVLLVHDNGPGIHRKDFDRVFDLHYTTKEHGCGMGLDICRKIAWDVKAGTHNGKVAVLRSLFLCGTSFEARLPMSLEEATSA